MSRGFTLIEVMLTIFILAIVMSVIYGVLVSVVESSRRAEVMMQGAEIGPAILAQIRDDLEGVLVTDKTKDEFLGIDRKIGRGDWDRVDFVTTTMTYDREKDDLDPKFYGLNEVGYQIQPHPEDTTLGRLHRRIDPWVDADPLKGGRLVEMYDRVRSFDITYVEDPQKPAESAWSSKQKEGKLPRAFKVTLVLNVDVRGGEANEDRTYTLTVTRAQ